MPYKAKSEYFVHDLQESLAIRLVIEDVAKTINRNLLERTIVRICMIMDKDRGEAINLKFDKAGKFMTHGQATVMKKDTAEFIQLAKWNKIKYEKSEE